MPIHVTVLPHPFDSFTRFEKEVSPQSIKELYASLNTGFGIGHCRCQINGEIITDFDYVPPDNSEVYIKVVPSGGGGGSDPDILGGVMVVLGMVVTMGGIVLTFFLPPVGAFLIGMGVSMVAGGVTLALYSPPSFPTVQDTSPISRPGIRGSKNTSRPYGHVPVLFGRHLVTPDFAALPYIDIANNDEYLVQLFCAGYNNMIPDPATFKVGDTALAELGATKDIHAVLAGLDPLIQVELLDGDGPGSVYPRRVKPIEINRQVKQYLSDDSDGAVVTTTPTGTTKIVVNFAFPQGLFGVDGKGRIIQVSLYVNIYFKRSDEDDSAYRRFGFIGDGAIVSGDYREGSYHSVSRDVEPGEWTIKVENGGPYNDAARYRYDALYLLSINAFQDGQPVAPEVQRHVQLIAIRVMATDRFNGIIDNFNFVAQAKLPSWSGLGTGPETWNTAESKNPASALVYALQGTINRKPVDSQFIDWPAVEAFFAWCEDHQYYCSAVLSNKITLMELLTQICHTARAMPIKRDGLFSLVQDIERGAHVQLLTPKNTIDYSETLGFADIPPALEMRFVDESSGWQDEVRTVYDTPSGEKEDTDPADFQDAPLWGVTNARQTFLLGRYDYACIHLRPRQHTITLDIEYLISYKGAWIKYSGDTALSGVAWGRIAEIHQTGDFITELTLDEMVQMEAGKTYRIRIRTAQNTQHEYTVVFDGTYTNTIGLEDPIPVSDGIQTGNLYAFGTVGEVTLDLLVVDIDPINDTSARLTCIDYAPDIFGVDDPDYVIPPWSPHVSVGGAVDSGVPGSPPPAFLDEVQEKVVNIEIETTKRPTYNEIVNGFTEAGVTVIPDPLTVAAVGGFRFIALSWHRQTSLSNLKEYQIQVSEDTVTWYAPRFDGVDWKGTEDAVFVTASTFVVHPNIPPAGTEAAPQGRLLYYRIRQWTMLDAYSAWSEVVGASTTLTDTGDYGVNSISANALKIAEFFALFAHIGETLIIDPAYGISSEEQSWAQGDTRAVLNAREIAFQYFLNQVWQTMARFGLEGLETSQLFALNQFFLTNDDMQGRRSKGFDIGAPYLSDNSRVVHYDVNMLDQYGQELFTMAGTGALVGDKESIALALKATAPYATESKALYGNFRLQTNIGITSLFTVDFWMLYKWYEEQVLFEIGNDTEQIKIEAINDEPYINDHAVDGVWLNDHPTDGVWLNEIRLAHTRTGHYLNGTWEYIVLEEFIADRWYHVGIIHAADHIQVAINNQVFPFGSQEIVDPIVVDINPMQGQIDGEYPLMAVDEVLIDATVAETLSVFYQNTILRRPWGKLDDQYPWFVINVKDPNYFRTNIFQSPDFAAAVQAIINGGT
ncbi:MAG: hypothetical protein LBQ14_07185 [Treponema sp.]|nr:hypothetical protein [Treponema sp.]